MKNKTLKIMSIVILTIITILLIAGNVLATGFVDITPTPTDAAKNVTSMAGKVLYITQVVGMAFAVIMLAVLGIKYVVASPNEKAEYKKGMTIYVIGAVLLFGASIIIGVIRTFAQNL